MKQISHLLSSLFSPLLVPTYGMAAASFLSILAILPSRVLWTTIAITFFITCILPAAGIFILYKMGAVKDPGLNERKERLMPYILTAICYLGCAFFLYHASAPRWLSLFFVGGAASVVINVLVNFRWKISAHAAAMGGLVALMLRLALSHQAMYSLNVPISTAILLAGMVMTARVYLGRHSLLQVLAGCANGFLCVWLISGL